MQRNGPEGGEEMGAINDRNGPGDKDQGKQHADEPPVFKLVASH